MTIAPSVIFHSLLAKVVLDLLNQVDPLRLNFFLDQE